jgi:hypothetical protein
LEADLSICPCLKIWETGADLEKPGQISTLRMKRKEKGPGCLCFEKKEERKKLGDFSFLLCLFAFLLQNSGVIKPAINKCNLVFKTRGFGK